MSTGAFAIWERAAQKSNLWLKELAEELGWEDLHHTYVAVRAVLHALRDRLTPQEAADLALQLPLLIKGVYTTGGARARPRSRRARRRTSSGSSGSRFGAAFPTRIPNA